MDTSKEGNSNGQEMAKTARSLAFARKGIKTGEDFANTMSALMSDLLEGNITPQVGNAVVNAGGKLLKVVELQYKYAARAPEAKERPALHLASGITDES